MVNRTSGPSVSLRRTIVLVLNMHHTGISRTVYNYTIIIFRILTRKNTRSTTGWTRKRASTQMGLHGWHVGCGCYAQPLAGMVTQVVLHLETRPAACYLHLGERAHQCKGGGEEWICWDPRGTHKGILVSRLRLDSSVPCCWRAGLQGARRGSTSVCVFVVSAGQTVLTLISRAASHPRPQNRET